MIISTLEFEQLSEASEAGDKSGLKLFGIVRDVVMHGSLVVIGRLVGGGLGFEFWDHRRHRLGRSGEDAASAGVLLDLGFLGGVVGGFEGGDKLVHLRRDAALQRLAPGPDLFASSGHDTKVRRQRARIIREAVKVRSG
ncbi:hypothetical protein [Caulobacter sp.]|uniref:hypothetical protein n=1 Tax=Caulobacter sp. TaxID=78 RepID=UPI0039C8884C